MLTLVIAVGAVAVALLVVAYVVRSSPPLAIAVISASGGMSYTINRRPTSNALRGGLYRQVSAAPDSYRPLPDLSTRKGSLIMPQHVPNTPVCRDWDQLPRRRDRHRYPRP